MPIDLDAGVIEGLDAEMLGAAELQQLAVRALGHLWDFQVGHPVGVRARHVHDKGALEGELCNVPAVRRPNGKVLVHRAAIVTLVPNDEAVLLFEIGQVDTALDQVAELLVEALGSGQCHPRVEVGMADDVVRLEADYMVVELNQQVDWNA